MTCLLGLGVVGRHLMTFGSWVWSYFLVGCCSTICLLSCWINCLVWGGSCSFVAENQFWCYDCQNFVIVVMESIFNSVDGFPERQLCSLTRLFRLPHFRHDVCMLDIYSAGVADVVFRNCYRILTLVLLQWNWYSCLLDSFHYAQPTSSYACLWLHGSL